jgi:hypothetical protein
VQAVGRFLEQIQSRSGLAHFSIPSSAARLTPRFSCVTSLRSFALRRRLKSTRLSELQIPKAGVDQERKWTGDFRMR